MIVASKFEGDDDTHFMWLQHDAYSKALGYIESQVKDFNDFAEAYLRLRRGVFPRSYDHRNIQRAHDILAACFRYRHPVAQLELSFDGAVSREESDARAIRAWLDWLKDECASWIVEPQIVSHFRDLMVESNTAFLNYWEEDLHFILIARYRDVPWSSSQTPGQRPAVPEKQLVRRHEIKND